MATGTFSTKTFLKLIEVCEEHGAHVVDDYSGRGMYGATCVAVMCDRHSPVTDYLKRSRAGEGCVDSMGMGRVHYWPGATVPEGAKHAMAKHMDRTGHEY